MGQGVAEKLEKIFLVSGHLGFRDNEEIQKKPGACCAIRSATKSPAG
jgi:hypothetical protein